MRTNYYTIIYHDCVTDYFGYTSTWTDIKARFRSTNKYKALDKFAQRFHINLEDVYAEYDKKIKTFTLNELSW